MSHTLLAQTITPVPSGSAGTSGIDLANFLVLKNGSKVSTVFDTPATMINLLVSNAFIAAGLITFVLIVLAGFKIISNESKGLEEAKTLLIQAGTGFLLIFGAYWIIQIVQILTGVKILF